MREDCESEKPIDLGFDKLRRSGLNQRILEQGLNPTHEQRGLNTPFALRNNFVAASRGVFIDLLRWEFQASVYQMVWRSTGRRLAIVSCSE
jgi:hypothetical protein